MTSHNEVIGIVYMVQIISGFLGNVFVIYHYCFNFFTHNRHRCINLILIQLSFANTVFLLSRGIPIAVFSIKVNFFLTDVFCKIIIYLQRVFRDLSLCNTCLLSGFQAIAISPNSPKWSALKVKSPKSIIPCSTFFWILNLLGDVVIPIYITDLRQNSTKNKGTDKLGFCSFDPYGRNTLNIQLWKSIFDFMFVAFMCVTSGYMMFLLYQHYHRVQYIHGTSLFPRVSPEIRATKVILLLVSTFFFFNSACSITTIYVDRSNVSGPWVFFAPMFLSMCFQSICPFLLLSSENWVPWKYCCLLQVMKESCAISMSSQKHIEPQNEKFAE